MSKKILKISLIISAIVLMCSCGQNSDIEKDEDELIKLEKDDSEQFDESFKNLIHSNPATMDYDFSKLQTESFHITLLESNDKNVRSYSYLTYYGCVYNIFQYRSSGKIYTTDQLWFHEYFCRVIDDPEYISDIKTLVDDNKTYYLFFAGKYNNDDDGSESEFGVTAFCIENNMMKTAPIFKISDKILPNIFICATLDNVGVDEHFFQFFYDEKEKILFVPETKKGLYNSSPYIDDRYWLTGKWIKYQFIDNCFQICEGYDL